MAKQAFREETLRTEKRKALCALVLKTIKNHVDNGITRVTSRQLYYRLVAANAVPNTEQSYKLVTALLTDMRYWGLIDWDFIVDLGRQALVPTQFRDVVHLAEAAVHSLRYDRWRGQKSYVEVWVEKQALQSVLEPIGDELHVPIVVNKGYSSASAMYQAARRLRFAKKELGRKPVVLYFGDLDPSGEDMVRDIGERLVEFGIRPDITKVALVLGQVLKYECPPNPAKTSDSRFEGYAEAMRSHDEYQQILQEQSLDDDSVYSWELDSLPVEVLDGLVRDTVRSYMDQELVDAIVAQEDRDKRAMRRAADAIREGRFSDDTEPDDEEEEEEEDPSDEDE